MKFAVFCSGSGSNFESIARAARKKGFPGELALMVCDRPGAFAVTRAHRLDIPVVLISPKLFKTRQAHEALITRILRTQSVDVIVLAGYMRILTPSFIRAWRGRILNIHPSLLPAFKGAHAIRDAFEAKVRTTGVSVHIVTEALDAGPVLAQKKLSVKKTDTLETLEKRIHAVEHRLYPSTLRSFITKLKRK